MVFGMTPFTLFHVLLSLIGIASGLVVLYGWLQSQRMPGWTGIFLFSTIATTLTGFLFPFQGFTPAIGVGLISTVILIVALFLRHFIATVLAARIGKSFELYSCLYKAAFIPVRMKL